MKSLSIFFDESEATFFITVLLFISHKPIKIYKSYYDDTKNLLFYASITFFIFILYYLMFPYFSYNKISGSEHRQNAVRKRTWAHKKIGEEFGRIGKEQQSQFHSFMCCNFFYSRSPSKFTWCDRQKGIFRPNKFHDLIFQRTEEFYVSLYVTRLGVNELEIMIAAGKAIKRLILIRFFLVIEILIGFFISLFGGGGNAYNLTSCYFLLTFYAHLSLQLCSFYFSEDLNRFLASF